MNDNHRDRLPLNVPIPLCMPTDPTLQERHIQEVREARRQRLEKQFGVMRVPARFQGLTPETLEALGPAVMQGKRKAIELVRAWAAGESNRAGLLLYGPPGTGKSALGWWAAPLRADGLGLWLTWPHLYKSIQAAYGNDQDPEALMEAAMTAPVLFLDDLGDASRKGLESDDRRDILFRIINHRNNEILPALITSNLDGSTIACQFGDRIASRLVELCEWCEVGGADLRTFGGAK